MLLGCCMQSRHPKSGFLHDPHAPLCKFLWGAACRHHRYIFEEKEKREPWEKQKSRRVVARLQELGPRFTLKLRSMQKGTFDSKHGEFEWLYNHKQMDRSRKRFFI